MSEQESVGIGAFTPSWQQQGETRQWSRDGKQDARHVVLSGIVAEMAVGQSDAGREGVGEGQERNPPAFRRSRGQERQSRQSR